ncbi:WD repeat-containing protein [Carpediemonas membranifera]|uniref:Cleavage stimulation factor 50 kDa subunit n=1 Tax=Carpediemonas membranifera TaxID=201153 RepID=A0A8J6E1Z0_9EUKA|nr:WD repeat-containing protein [Carpediemonas membranifera]|eukprot:KAG9393656.1 WD repeat-containing protein [Carpediemonas membranifera]
MASKRQLYQLIAGQLEADGFLSAAVHLAEATKTPMYSGIGPQLSELALKGASIEGTNTLLPFSAPSATIPNIPPTLAPAHTLELSKGSIHFKPTYKCQVEGAVTVLKFDDDGGWLAVGTTKTLSLWSVGSAANGADPVVFSIESTDPVTSLAFHPFVAVLVVGRGSGAIQMIDVAAQKQVGSTFQMESRVNSIAWHFRGDHILATVEDSTAVRVIDVVAGTSTTLRASTIENPIAVVAAHKDYIALGDRAGGLTIVDSVDMTTVAEVKEDSAITGLAFSQSGSSLVMTTYAENAAGAGVGSIATWDTRLLRSDPIKTVIRQGEDLSMIPATFTADDLVLWGQAGSSEAKLCLSTAEGGKIQECSVPQEAEHVSVTGTSPVDPYVALGGDGWVVVCDAVDAISQGDKDA